MVRLAGWVAMDNFRVDVVCELLNKVSTSECADIEAKAVVLSDFLTERHGLRFPYADSGGAAFAEAGMRCRRTAFPAAFFACFKRFVAHVLLGDGSNQAPPQPVEDLARVHHDPMLLRAMSAGAKSHILSHGCHGFFAPVEFRRPLFDSDGEVFGGWVGSCQALVEELCTPALTVALDITLASKVRRVVRRGGGGGGGGGGTGGFDLSDDTIQRLLRTTEGEEEHPFWIERAVWFLLYEAARFSIECESAVIMVPSLDDGSGGSGGRGRGGGSDRGGDASHRGMGDAAGGLHDEDCGGGALRPGECESGTTAAAAAGVGGAGREGK